MEDVGHQLLLAAGLTLATVLIHVLGSGVVLVLIRRHVASFRHSQSLPRLTAAMLALVMGLVLLHAAEIALFAAAYVGVYDFADWEAALYFSTANYTTVGAENLTGDRWRLVGAWEGFVGFILIGWSTALFITVILRIWSEDHKWFEPPA